MLYNELLPVETAIAQLSRRPEFPAFLQRFRDIAVETGVGSRFGAVLLHRHFYLAPDKLLAERCGTHDGRNALLAAPETKASSSDLAPVRWALDPAHGTFNALEYSDDPLARTLGEPSDPFLSDCSALLVELGMTDLLGLGLADRSHLPLRDDQFYLEASTDEASIVTAAHDSGQGGPTIETMWVPSIEHDPKASGRCRQVSRCRARCHFDVDNKHRYRHEYAFEHDPNS